MAKRGISLLDLLDLPPGIQGLVPEQLATRLEQLAVVEHRSITTGRAYVHTGVVQSFEESFAIEGMRDWPIALPGLNAGIPFRLAYRRGHGTADLEEAHLEEAPDHFHLDLLLDRFAITLPGLKPAARVEPEDAAPPYLNPDTSIDKVRVVGRAVLRIASIDGQVTVSLVHAPDPLDPFAPAGAVATVSFEPPHFFFGDSRFGMTVGRHTIDCSKEYTPPAILASGHDDAWVGVAIEEATFYFPPDMGTVSVGVRDVLLGDPLGIEGELRVSFGVMATDEIAVEFTAGDDPLAVEGATQARTVRLPTGRDSAAVRGTATLDVDVDGTTTGGFWSLPGGGTAEGLESPEFEARDGTTVRFQGRLIPEDEPEEWSALPEVSFVFRAAEADAASATRHAPLINVSAGSTLFRNVTSLSGGGSAMAGLEFLADLPDGSDRAATLTWQLDGPAPLQRSGLTFSPRIPTEPGTYQVVLSEGARTRRVRIDVLAEGELIVGAEGGARRPSGEVIDGTRVDRYFDLAAFHAAGDLMPAQGATRATQAPGTLAEATIDSPPDDSRPSVMTAFYGPDIRFDIEGDTPDRGGEEARDWAAALLDPESQQGDPESQQGYHPDAHFVVIGRTDDGWGAAENEDDRRSENRDLAVRRARHIATTLGVPADRVFWRGEQGEGWGDNRPPPEEIATALPPNARSFGWLIETETGLRGQNYRPHEFPRPDYRRVDVYAVYPVTSQTSTTPSSPRTAFVPADDAPAPPATVRDRAPATPYAVSLVVRWDSPTVRDLADAIPTLAELTVKIRGDRFLLPQPSDSEDGDEEEEDDEAGADNPAAALGREVLTFRGCWTHDARSGQTLFVLECTSSGDPNGLFGAIDSVALAGAMMFGPPLLGALKPSEPGTDFATVLGLLAASAFLGELQIGDQPALHSGKTSFKRLAVESRSDTITPFDGRTRLRLLCDYSVELGFYANVGFLVLETTDGRPVRVRCRNVGLMIEVEGGNVRSGGIDYAEASFEVETAGQWRISGPLGDLLGISGVRTFEGSLGVEFDLRFALDMGVISITGAKVRLSFSEDGGIGFELRGLSAAVNIPGTLRGSGSLSIGDNGSLRAALDLEVIPANVQGRGSLVYDAANDFWLIEVGVRLPAGLPLGATGLGIFGFIGRFVTNGTRDLTRLLTTDPIDKEIEWYRDVPPINKYGPLRGQWALGLGAIVGTLPDNAFTFNATGMLVIEFPEPLVLFGIQAFFAKQAALPSEGGEEASGRDMSLELLGLIAVDRYSFRVGVRGRFEIEELLKLEIPISGYFPFPGTPGELYVRIGQDGVTLDPAEGYGFSRTGSPITLILLPKSLNVRVWAFVMIEERRLNRLGEGLLPLPGGVRLDLQGFSIGFGAGFTIDWSAGPLRLLASLGTLMGFGTRPLTLVGALVVRGELSLLILRLALEGVLVLRLRAGEPGIPGEERLDGEFCAEVSFCFFSVRACIEFHIGDSTTPKPPSPLLEVALVDRRGVGTGKTLALTAPPATWDSEEALGATVWPDTIPLLRFAHQPVVQAESGTPGYSWSAPFYDPPQSTLWTGTSDLKYAYRLVEVALEPVDEGAPRLSGTVDAAWWWRVHRPGLAPGSDAAPAGSDAAPAAAAAEAPASEHEVCSLALLTWRPDLWAESMGARGGETPGDPARTVARSCEQSPAPTRVCVLGKNARYDRGRVVLTPDDAGAPPFAGRLTVFGQEALHGDAAAPAAVERGYALVAGDVCPFDPPPSERGLPKALYEVGCLTRYGRFVSTVEFSGKFAPAIFSPELLLAFAPETQRASEALEQCDSYQSLGQFQSPTLTRQGLRYAAIAAGEVIRSEAIAGRLGLVYGPGGLRIALPYEADGVRLEVASRSSPPEFTVRALNAAGTVVAERSAAVSAGSIATVAVEGIAIVAVEIRGGLGKGALLGLCYSARPRSAMPHPLQQIERGLPRVFGIGSNGTAVEWPRSPAGATADSQLLRYVAPTKGSWVAFRIVPSAAGRVGIVRLCGVTWEQQVAQAHDAAHRSAFVAAWNAHAWLPDHGVPPPETSIADVIAATPHARVAPPLLEPGTVYRVRVRWQGAVWQKSDTSLAPPPIDELDGETRAIRWQGPDAAAPFFEEIRYFRTAPAGDPPPVPHASSAGGPPPIDFIGEHVFDPRGVLRYMRGTSPTDGAAFHCIADPLLIHFTVDHLPLLLRKYGYRLELRVHRTDPPAGSRVDEHGNPLQLLNLISGFLWAPAATSTLAPAVQRMIASARQDAPCLSPQPGVGGMTGVVTADLQPGAAYDLVLHAVPDGGDAPVFLSRSHFRTSRYRRFADLLAKLGFPSDAPGRSRPYEFSLASGVTLLADVDIGNDAALEAELRRVGIDPWPLAPSPRTVAIWSRRGSEWIVAGWLLEADEPLRRPRGARRDAAGRWDFEPALLQVNEIAVTRAAADAGRFVPVRSNATWTRVLFAPAAGSTAGPGDHITLRVAAMREPPGAVPEMLGMETEGALILGGLPRIAYEERA